MRRYPTPWEVTESGKQIEIQDAAGTSIAVILEGDRVKMGQKICNAVNRDVVNAALLKALKFEHYVEDIPDHDEGKCSICEVIGVAEGRTGHGG